MNRYKIRPVEESDAEEILKIYEPFVKNTSITFECEVPSIDEFRARIRQIINEYPYLVCLNKDDKIIGYAYAHRHMERQAYRWNAELSVYILPEYSGHGIGKKLYSEVISILKEQNIRNLYAGIALPNKASIRLHESLGFTHLGM